MIGDKRFLNMTISTKLSDYLKKYAGSKEWGDVSNQVGISTSTIRNLVYRQVPITEGNKEAVIELMKVAIKNAMKSKSEDSEVELFIKETLKQQK